MPLVPAQLASGLEGLGPAEQESAAISALVSAWKGYFKGASVLGSPIETAALNAAMSAFQGGLTGMSQPGAGAAKIASAVTLFWAALVNAAPTAWKVPPGAVTLLTPPPTLGALAGAIQSAFSSTAAQAEPPATLAQAANKLATAMHTSGGVGAFATVQPPPPAPPVPTPVL